MLQVDHTYVKFKHDTLAFLMNVWKCLELTEHQPIGATGTTVG